MSLLKCPTSPTKGQIIKCKAAVVWEANKLTIEQIQVHPPKSNEVRVQVVACGLCGSDNHILRHPPPYAMFPVVLGHEVAGIVESFGDQVKGLSVGDHVMVTMLPQCGKCNLCQSGDMTNLCQGGTADGNCEKFTMPDGTTRIFTADGSPLYKYLNVGGFAEYLVTTEDCVVKIAKDVPMDKFCVFACGITTGYGSVSNLSRVKRGASIAVWGLGAVGLGAIRGAKDMGAKDVVAIGRGRAKEELAKKFGVTDYIDTNELTEPLDKVLRDKYGGIDAGIDCVGNTDIMKTIISASKPWGATVVAGLAFNPLEIIPIHFITGKVFTSGPYGGFRGKDAVNYFAKRYKNIPLDDMISGTLKLDDVLIKGFDQLGTGITKLVVLIK